MAFALLATGASPATTPISLASDQWSRSPIRWTISPDGSIVYQRDDREFIPVEPLHMALRQTGSAPARYQRIAAILSPAKAQAGKAVHCDVFVTEGEQGTIRWGALSRFDYDMGCQSSAEAPAQKAVAAAQKQIAAWVQGAPVVVEKVITTQELKRHDP